MATMAGAVADTIELLRKRIQQIRERKEVLGEENTKATLIDPLLAALGWDLHEIDEVRREYRRKPQDNPVDYALFLNRTECLFIEAKSLEKDLSDHRWVTQNLSYATAAGVQWCVLTNGDEYRIYNAHAPVVVEEKLFRSVRISETDAENRPPPCCYCPSNKCAGACSTNCGNAILWTDESTKPSLACWPNRTANW